MNATPRLIESISDTARWVAIYRAMETERPDAHFRDPWARRLAGERGEAIVREMPRAKQTAWPMIVRTAVMDEIIRREVAAGADAVLNLAAGLDTRPYRLELPAALRWYDVDLPGIQGYKREALAGEKPRCALEYVALDLASGTDRRALFARAGAASKRVLVVTEGLLVYLEAGQVASLARDLHEPPSFALWLLDIASPLLLEFLRRSWGKNLEQGNAPFQFAPPGGTKFFGPGGGREREHRPTWAEAKRLRRTMGPRWLIPLFELLTRGERREHFMERPGTVLLERV